MLPLMILLAGVAFSAAPVALADSGMLTTSQNPETLAPVVREYFKDEPVMAAIAFCESRFRHTNPDGTIFRGVAVPQDIGVMQINTTYHEAKAKEMGLDLYSLDGNLAYAKFLYETQGTKPWNASRPCWGKIAVK